MIRSYGHNLVVAAALAVSSLASIARGANAAAPVAPADAAPDPAAIEFFEKSVRPVLADACYRCHSSATAKPKGGLKLDTRDALFAGGESGPSVLPGDVEKSLLLRAVRYDDKELQMPPKKKLDPEQIAALEAWVKMGAPFPADAKPAQPVAGASTQPTGPVAMTVEEARSFWSFKSPVDPPAPQVKTAGWAKSTLDAFILGKLEEKGIAPSPQADKRTLIRRATYDLTGLPPTAEEIQAFENDPSPDAFEKVVDRLLASPRYGERWGRLWLDVARYADTKGYVFEEERRYAYSYTYRDWVIRAFNEDLPYDQFLIQQIAADKLDLKDDKRPLAALGFLTLGRRFLNNPHDIIDDRIDVVTRGTMGLTVSCARCHDHKYDPIPTADYYSLYGVFASAREPEDLPEITTGEKSPERLAYDAELAKRRQALDDYVKAKHAEIVAELRKPEVIARYLLAAQKGLGTEEKPFETLEDGKSLTPFVVKRWEAFLKKAAEQNDPVFATWRAFASLPKEQFEAQAAPTTQRAIASTAPSVHPLVAKEVVATAPKTIEEVAQRYAALLAKYDKPEPLPDANEEAIRQVLRGEGTPTNVGPEDARHLFSVADNAHRRNLRKAVDELKASHPGSPPRAMALEDLPTPMTPKVFRRGNPGNLGDEVPRQFLEVLSPPGQREPFKDSGRLELAKLIASGDNPLTARVMVNRVWLHHFGAGLVRTPSDFGTRGDPPTHPELLDWLARRFVEDGWSVKKLHKRLMLSAAYQQASFDNPDARKVDPENLLVWRMNPRRLDLESLRDSLLAASGKLDLTAGGRPVDILAQPFVGRRTVYAFIDRQNLPGMFRTFDFASPDATSPQRPSTSVPQQALFMMNSPFVLEQAKGVAARAEVAGESDTRRRVAALYRAALGREPTAGELDLGVRFIDAETSQPPPAEDTKPTAWQYGFGVFDEAQQRVTSFTPLAHFGDNSWRGGPALPDAATGWAMLTAAGGHAGNDHQHATIRRWVAPRDGTVSIAGTLEHNHPEGDGVRARIVTPREGLVAQWVVHAKEAKTEVTKIAVRQGEAIDFVVDCGRAGNVNHDSFGWKVTLTKAAAVAGAAGDDTGGSWDSAAEFAGPPPKPATPLTAWEKYAQVLLQCNEFAFVD